MSQAMHLSISSPWLRNISCFWFMDLPLKILSSLLPQKGQMHKIAYLSILWSGRYMCPFAIGQKQSKVMGRCGWISSYSGNNKWSYLNSIFTRSVATITITIYSFSSVHLLSHVPLFVTPWITARQASLSITISRSSLRLTSIESVMPSSHLILCHPLLLLSPIPLSIRVFSNESALRVWL